MSKKTGKIHSDIHTFLPPRRFFIHNCLPLFVYNLTGGSIMGLAVDREICIQNAKKSRKTLVFRAKSGKIILKEFSFFLGKIEGAVLGFRRFTRIRGCQGLLTLNNKPNECE